MFRIRVILLIDPGVQTFHCAEVLSQTLKSTFHCMHHFSSMKTYGICRSCMTLVATLHWMRHFVGIILFFPMVRGKQEKQGGYPSMSRGFPQDRHLFCRHKRRYRIKNLYPTRTNVCAGAIVARGWLKSSEKPLNENLVVRHGVETLSGQPLNLVRPCNDCFDLMSIFQSRRLP